MTIRGKYLSSVYSNKTISAIIDEAINLKYKLTFIDMAGNDRELTRGHLATIRAAGIDSKALVYTPNRTGVGFGDVRHIVCYSVLRADEATFAQLRKEFGAGDKDQDQNGAINITPLSSEQIEERKEQIKELSLERRAHLIKSRGSEIYLELEKKYRARFYKEVVAEFIQGEEKAIYESLDIPLPPVNSYLKHTRTPTRRAEYSGLR